MNFPVPKITPEEIRKLPPLLRLQTIMNYLRSENGCPWDKEQTHTSIADCVVEEAHELVEAILSGDTTHMVEELGDVLLQVIFHSQLGSEKGLFDFDNVAETISEKLLVRHPHVFGESVATNSDEVKDLWEKIKLSEKGKEERGVLGGVSKGLPPLQKAEKIQKKAGKQGFDWEGWQGALDKIQEEILEFKSAMESGVSEHAEEELGDVLFSVVNLSRKAGISPTVALEKANQKFTKRFETMENQILKQNLVMKDLTIDQWESFWQEAKTMLK